MSRAPARVFSLSIRGGFVREPRVSWPRTRITPSIEVDVPPLNARSS